MNEQVVEMQRQTIEQIKSAQTQIVEMNVRIADSMMGMMPAMPAPFAEYMPKPAEMMTSYLDFLGEMGTANREFAQSMMAAWTPTEEAPAPAKKK